MLNPWFGMGLVLLCLVGLMGGLRLWQRTCRPHPELVRKLLHVGMGLVALSFPWLFAEVWPVLLLAAITAPGMLGLRFSARWQEKLGGVIGGVARSQSLGEVYFPLGVAGLFWLAGDQPLLYCIALLLLAVADAAAALVGVRYGRLRYTAAAGAKSAEGSLAFFAAAFFCAYLPLLLYGGLGGDRALLGAVVSGLWGTRVEAAAGQGLDNLFIPVAGFAALAALLNAAAPVLTVYLLLSLAACLLVWRNYVRLNDSAL